MFTMEPGPEIGRLQRARITIPYPWIDGETHHLNVLTSTGVTFEHTIEVATPRATDRALLPLLLVGLLLGLAPVAAGMLAFPAIRDAPPAVTSFVLALTIGLLAYLFVDTLSEGIEVAEGVIYRMRAETLVWVSMVATTRVLLGVGRLGGRAPEGAALAFFVALGIGLHNFGEGLVVGAAISPGAAALAVFLVVGFIIHNVSEGFAIAAPMVSTRPPLWIFVALAALAGLPALPGVALGAMAVSAYWTALCFGIGAGAIAQVIIEVSAYLVRRMEGRSPVTAANVAGAVLGLAIMYSTALLV
jgi:zinc transporter ZupT